VGAGQNGSRYGYVFSLIRISLARFEGLDLKEISALSSGSAHNFNGHNGKLKFRRGLDRKRGNLIKEIGRGSHSSWTGHLSCASCQFFIGATLPDPAPANEDLHMDTPTVGLEPTTARLRALRSAD